LIDFDKTGIWGALPHRLIAGLKGVVNEYDRMLGAVRLEIFAKASDYLDHLMIRAADETSGHTGPAAARTYRRNLAAT
jgi:hypothetical protein